MSAKAIFDAVAEHGITHFGAAPVVLGMLVNAPDDQRRRIDHPVKVMTAGAPPPAAILEKMNALGFNVLQVYGLTETFGHVVECIWRGEWDELSTAEQAVIKARQGVRFPVTEEMRVVDVATRQPVPADGASQGEIVIRGNTVMKGYLQARPSRDRRGLCRAAGSIPATWQWFIRAAIMEVKDRLKDVIISGGENISSIEVENARSIKHPKAIGDQRGGCPKAGREVGRNTLAPSSSSSPAAMTVSEDGNHRLLPPSALLASKCRSMLSSTSCPRRPRARSRNSSCGSKMPGLKKLLDRAIVATEDPEEDIP